MFNKLIYFLYVEVADEDEKLFFIHVFIHEICFPLIVDIINLLIYIN